MDCLRDHQAVLFCTQEVELESMADATRLVDGCEVRHDESSINVQLPSAFTAAVREANGVDRAAPCPRMYSVIIPEATR